MIYQKVVGRCVCPMLMAVYILLHYVLYAFEAVLSHCHAGKLSEVVSKSMPREDSTERGKQSLKFEALM